MSITEEIGQNIVLLRRQRGVTQEDLALSAGMSPSYLRRIEHGKANPSVRTLCRIADALNEPFSSVVSTKAS